MSLSERLKQAEAARHSTTGARPATEPPASATLDLSGSAAVIDLTERQARSDAGITYSPLRDREVTGGFIEAPDVAAATAHVRCPRCGGPTRLDLFDQVHQMASLSCTSCFHMFRVEPSV